MEIFTEFLLSGVSLGYPTVVKVALQPRSTAFESPVNSEVWLVQWGVQKKPCLLCSLKVLYGQENDKWRQHKTLALLTPITREWTVILVCLLALQRSPSSTISFLLNTRQLSSLTYDNDKAQTAQKLFAVVRWKCRDDALVWNWFLFLGFLWWLSAHHHSFQSMRNNQSAVCISFLLNSTWESTFIAGYRMKQKMETVCCRLFTDCCWANLITNLCNSIIISLDENITDLNFVKKGKNRHNPCITVTANSAVMGRGQYIRTSFALQLRLLMAIKIPQAFPWEGN